jgi:hypothetical protein
MIKPPANSCAQGVGGKCKELAEGNELILKLQQRSAENRLKYQKQVSAFVSPCVCMCVCVRARVSPCVCVCVCVRARA